MEAASVGSAARYALLGAGEDDLLVHGDNNSSSNGHTFCPPRDASNKQQPADAAVDNVEAASANRQQKLGERAWSRQWVLHSLAGVVTCVAVVTLCVALLVAWSVFESHGLLSAHFSHSFLFWSSDAFRSTAVPEWSAHCVPPPGAIEAGRWLSCNTSFSAHLCAHAAFNIHFDTPLTANLVSCCSGGTARNLNTDGNPGCYVPPPTQPERLSHMAALNASTLPSALLDGANQWWANAEYFDADEQCGEADRVNSRYFTAAEGRALLSGKRLLFVGDSTMQELLMDLMAWLEDSPADLDHTFDAWTSQQQCGGRSVHYQQRSLATSRFPSPALSLFNISLHHQWNGHESECDNVGPIAHQQQPTHLSKLQRHAHTCANRSAHLHKLQSLFATPLTDLLADGSDDSTERREQLFQQLRALREPVNASYPLLEQASQALMTAERTAAAAPIAEPVNATQHSITPWTTLCPAPQSARSFDYVIYNTGQHLVPVVKWEQWRPDPLWLAEYEALVQDMITRFRNELLVDGGAVVWKDSTPAHMYPGLLKLNAIARQIVDRLDRNLTPSRNGYRREEGERRRVLVWPVSAVLTGLVKRDDRHCSYKDLRAGATIDTRDRHVRTHWCHTAVQMLLRTLANHEGRKQQR